MTLDCEAAMRRLWEYLDAELPAPDMAAVRAHVAECASCRGHVEFERELLEAVARIGPVDQVPAPVPVLLRWKD